MQLNHYAVILSIFAISHAWPWPAPLFGDGLDIAVMHKRQNDNTRTSTGNDIQATATPTTQSSITNAPSQTTARLVSANGGNQPITVSHGGGNATLTEFDPRDPAGGISMMTPAPTAGAQYYKIGDWVHFAWNYTSLQANPSAVNIVASCSQNQATYTLAANQSYAPTGEVYWDTGAYQSSASIPLLTNQYTLIIYDSSQQISAAARPGYLASYNQFTFAMYSPQPYTPWDQFKISCPTCLGNAASSLERMTLTALLAMTSLTVLTFTWFLSGVHLI